MTAKKGTNKVKKEDVKETKGETVINSVEFVEEQPEIKTEEDSKIVTPESLEEDKVETVKKKGEFIETTDVNELKSIKGTNKTLRGIIYTGIPKYTK